MPFTATPGGMGDQRPDPTQLGISKRQQMEDDYRRRGLLRDLQTIRQKNPQLLQQVASKHTAQRTSGNGGLSGSDISGNTNEQNRQQPSQQSGGNMGRQGNPVSLTGGSVVDAALNAYGGGQRRGGGGGGRGGGGMGGGNAYPGSPAYVGADWGVSSEERKAAETFDNPYYGPEGNDAQAQERIRERLNSDLDASADAQRMLLRGQAGDNAYAAAGGGGAGDMAKATTRQGTDVRIKAQQEIEKLKYKRAMTSDAQEIANIDAGIAYQQQLAGAVPETTTTAPAPISDMANRESWSLDPDLQTAMLTNRPEILSGAKKVLVGPDQALAAKYPTVNPVASHAQPMGSDSYTAQAIPTADTTAAQSDPKQVEFEAKMAALKEKKAKKSGSSGGEKSSSANSEKSSASKSKG